MKRLIFCLAAVLLPLRATAADFDAAAATNQVGLDLYRELAAEKPAGNLVLSPYSIESALALAYAGADGATRTEMARVLRFPAEDAPLESAFAGLRGALDGIARDSQAAAGRVQNRGGKSDVIEWHAANRLFGQRGYAFRDAFLARMKDGYAAPFEPLDFRNDAEAARSTINSWVEEQTRKKIRDLIPRDGIKSDTRLVLVNALYLKAPWEKPFSEHLTSPAPFHAAAGATRDVPTMRSSSYLGHAAEDGLTIVSIDYLGGGLQFLILLPAPGQGVEAAATKLTPEHFARWAKLGERGSAPRAQVDLYLPKFRVEGATVPLGQALRALGVKSAFDQPRGSANFDRIAPRKPDDYLAISEVFHQTFIALDEAGTEAAAATAVTMVTLAAMAEPPKRIEVRVDRPFLFAIQHRASGACLFLGRIDDPR